MAAWAGQSRLSKQNSCQDLGWLNSNRFQSTTFCSVFSEKAERDQRYVTWLVFREAQLSQAAPWPRAQKTDVVGNLQKRRTTATVRKMVAVSSFFKVHRNDRKSRLAGGSDVASLSLVGPQAKGLHTKTTFIREQATVLRAPLASTMESCPARASNLFGAVTKGRPVSAAIRAAISSS